MKKQYMLILILILVVGFASVTTSLILKGNIGVGVELDDFDVIFIEALLGGKEDSKATISEDKKTITFTTDRFINKGDTARLDYKVKNTSTQYDADVTINCTNEASEYVTVTSEFNGNSIPLENPVNIKAQEVKSGYISAELSKTYAGEDDSLEISCKITFTATSSEDYAYSLTFDSNGGSKVEDKVIILDKAYGELQEPAKEGYTFLGWYDELDEKVDSSTILDTKGNRTLYAKWEKEIYQVNIIVNGSGKVQSNRLSIAYDETGAVTATPNTNYFLSNVECDNGYVVQNYNPKVLSFNSQTINIVNNKVTRSATCTFTFMQGVYAYNYIGGVQTFTAPIKGKYKVELWGAQGSTVASSYPGGKGSYTSGNISLNLNTNLYVYVGQGGTRYNGTNKRDIFNGGGNGNFWCIVALPNAYTNVTGGGASDVRLVNGNWNNFESLKSRIMVASGGGGSTGYAAGGSGGGLTGYAGSRDTRVSGNYSGSGGAQSSGGSVNAKFGVGGDANYSGNACNTNDGAGGGGGYYGGGGSKGTSVVTGGTGGGGSSFISGHSGCNAINASGAHTGQPNHYSGYVFTSTSMIGGNSSMPTHDGTGTMTGNSGNGYAKITLISID